MTNFWVHFDVIEHPSMRTFGPYTEYQDALLVWKHTNKNKPRACYISTEQGDRLRAGQMLPLEMAKGGFDWDHVTDAAEVQKAYTATERMRAATMNETFFLGKSASYWVELEGAHRQLKRHYDDLRSKYGELKRDLANADCVRDFLMRDIHELEETRYKVREAVLNNLPPRPRPPERNERP